jgi:hypothetical protein
LVWCINSFACLLLYSSEIQHNRHPLFKDIPLVLAQVSRTSLCAFCQETRNIAHGYVASALPTSYCPVPSRGVWLQVYGQQTLENFSKITQVYCQQQPWQPVKKVAIKIQSKNWQLHRLILAMTRTKISVLLFQICRYKCVVDG